MKKENTIVIDGVEYIKKDTALFDRAASKLLNEIESTECKSAKDVESLANATNVLLQYSHKVLFD